MIVENTYIAKLVYIENMDVYLLILFTYYINLLQTFIITQPFAEMISQSPQLKKFPINTVYSKNATENFN